MTDDRPLYVVFGRWVEARQFARDQGFEIPGDVVCATQHHAALAAIEHAERRIVFVRTTTPVTDYERLSWLHLANISRARNESNDYITEIMNV